jgi:DNA mismatch repair protein PMS2
MKVIGQFNLGFIITRLNNDLFIIDQPAADEKYKFEQYQKETVINSQPLIQPLSLEVSASEAAVIEEHIDVFKANGFEFINHDDSHHLKLTAVPYSKDSVFGVNDVHALCHMLSENNNGEMCRIPKILEMFASRSCRTAVMIGMVLEKSKMQSIVYNMSQTEHPWSCPHGRPTARHLIDMNILHNYHKTDKYSCDSMFDDQHEHAEESSSSNASTLELEATQLPSTQPLSQFKLAVSIR